MISIMSSGNWNNTEAYLRRLSKKDPVLTLQKYGEIGIQKLKESTPVKTGKTAMSWRYEIVKNDTGYSLEFHNDNVENGVNIAIILDYGHDTKNHGYVEGLNYIDPTIRPVFDTLADSLWKEVKP